jgi:signal transduction histidine kinase
MKLLYSMISARRSDVRKHMLLARRPLHEKRKGRGDIMGSASNGVSLDVGEVEAQPGLSKRSRLKRFLNGIAGQLLLYTVGFVLLAQVLIFPVSIAALRNTWLLGRSGAAELSTLAAQSMPGRRMSDEFARVFLERQGTVSIVVTSGDRRETILAPRTPVDAEIIRIDPPSGPALFAVPATLSHVLAPEGRLLRISFKPQLTAYDEMEVTIRESGLKAAFWSSSGSILLNSFFLSAVAGALVYFAVYRLVVRPMQEIAAAVTRFSDAPDATTIDLPEGGNDEISRVATALGDMQQTVSAALRQRKRLADLGEAVAKICHDLRNSLSAAQVLSDGLADSNDPQVRDAAPRLERAIERSITLAESTLRYGRAETPLPNLKTMDLRAAIEEAIAEGLTGSSGVTSRLDCDPDVRVIADPDHVHRIVTNLVRNAAKAIGKRTNREEAGLLTATVRVDASSVALTISDNGPGISRLVMGKLFQPFAKAGSDGGAGLGLAIARELARGMGGELELASTNASGASFVLLLRNAQST